MWEDQLTECLHLDCRCKCHPRLSARDYLEFGIFKPGFEAKGTFPFLSLPNELRQNIYLEAFLQSGSHRVSPNHRGTIHTALLRTCRQVYEEAGHLPLALNQPCFKNANYAHDFIGFSLTAFTRPLFSSLVIELDFSELYGVALKLLLRRLANLRVKKM